MLRLAGSLVAIALTLALIAIGSFVTYAEGRANLAAANSIERLSGIEDLLGSAGLSTRTQTQRLLDCYTALSGYRSLVMLYVGTNVRDRIVSDCAALADKLVAQQPTLSYGWLVGAVAAVRLQDWEKMNRYLIASQHTGSGEQWIAIGRVRLSEDNLAQMSADALRVHEMDLAMLINSRVGVAAIARRYVSNPAFRERIVAIVETLPTDDQYRFLNNVKIAYNVPGYN